MTSTTSRENTKWVGRQVGLTESGVLEGYMGRAARQLPKMVAQEGTGKQVARLPTQL